jgi:uncharacterized protein (TIGR02246 family)
MDELEGLLAERACTRLVIQSVAHVDRGEPAALAALFAPDGVLVRPGGASLLGRAAIQAAYEQRPVERITRHLVSNTLVEVVSPTEARAESQVLLWTGSAADVAGPRGRPASGGPVVGAFDDRFVKTGEGWRIASRVASFVLHAADRTQDKP